MSETFFLSITISERARSYLAEGIAFMKREFNNLDGQIPVITFPLFWYSLDDPTKIHGSGKNGGPCVSFGSTA